MLNEPALRDYLREHLPHCDDPFAIAALSGGQSNPAFRLRCGSHSYVLRKQPEGVLLPSAHAVDRVAADRIDGTVISQPKAPGEQSLITAQRRKQERSSQSDRPAGACQVRRVSG